MRPESETIDYSESANISLRTKYVSNKEFQSFDLDVQANGSYQYTTGATYSAVTANARISDLTINAIDWKGLKVLDVGCGDGEYTFELYRRGNPSEITGIDLSPAAIAAATERVSNEAATFSVCSGSRLPFSNDSFDVVHMRGVLHHMENPMLAVAEALRVAQRVYIIEPNGWNPGLKCIEVLSTYHRQHNERSFRSTQINGWIKSQKARVLSRKWAGFVPFFCPETLAKCMKQIEPLLEALPIVRQLTCAVYVVVGVREPAK
jgi:ubiquinone/menaquinone biosynthesis C-methylase UbiE